MRIERYILLLGLVLLSMVITAQEELPVCTDGTLIFREDFGGNDPSDPAVSMASVPGMSSQYHNSGNSLGSGNYTIRKEGWHNGIQWHWQDDHTYPDDKTRGYLLEIDGIGGSVPFYRTTINNVVPGSKLSFSAYVVNVHYAGQLDYFGSSYVYPRLKFIIKDPRTGAILGSRSTGDIQPDWRYGTPETWAYARENQLSAEWQLVGITFIVPAGVETVDLYIYNDVAQNGSGNDFAIDDIEVRLCVPPVEIEVPDTVYAGDVVTMTSTFTNDGTCTEPIEYQWYFSRDSVNWTEVSGASSADWTGIAYDGTYSGWYRLAIYSAGERGGSYCSISLPKKMTVLIPPLCRDGRLLFHEDFGGNDPSDPVVSHTPVPGMSNRYQQTYCLDYSCYPAMGSGRYLVAKHGFRNSTLANYSVWHIMDDHTYFSDTTRGYFLEIDGKGGNDAFYSTTLDGLCAGSKLTFSAYIANLTTAGQYNVWRHDRPYAFPQLTFVITDLRTGEELTHFSTDTISHDWSLFGVSEAWRQTANWQQIGMNFVVPQGVDAVKLSIRNNVNESGTGNDFALDDIEVRLCVPPITILAPPDSVCIDTKNTFHAVFENDGSFREPLQYQWYFSADSVTWTAISDGNTKDWKLKAKPKHTGWYKVAVASSGNVGEENCRSISEPVKLYVIDECPPILCPEGVLLFREDFGGNDPSDPRVGTAPVAGMSYSQLTDDHFGMMHSGSYLVTKEGYCNGDTSMTNLPQNRRSQWHLQDDHTYPGDKTRGYFLEIDGKGDNAAFYSTTIESLCAGSDLSFIAYVANVMTWGQYVGRPGYYAYPRLMFRLTDPVSGAELGAYDTGEIPFDSTFINDYSCWKQSSAWHQVGMNFTVPEGLSSVKLTIYNNSRGTTGNDFAIDDIEVRLCLEPIAVSGNNPACRKKPHVFRALYENYGILENPEYQWSYSADSVTWTVLQTSSSKNYTIPNVHRYHEGWYKVTVANAGNMDQVNCREESEPFKLHTQYCNTAVDQYVDTTACDTLLEYNLTWRGHEWPAVGTVVDTLIDIDDDDSVYVHKTLQTKICCPDIQYIRIDSITCDTLMPFLWFFRDTMLLFEDIGSQDVEYPHYRWENCIGEIFTLALDTMHCERLYDLIVNKYNWQLLLDYTKLRRIFPERKYLAFQWYKNGEEIPGATDDDYSEQNELCGLFQLRIQLDEAVDNDDEFIWSKVLEIGEVEEPQPIIRRIYNWHGMLVGEGQMTRGVYLIVNIQGDKIWTEKKIVL